MQVSEIWFLAIIFSHLPILFSIAAILAIISIVQNVKARRYSFTLIISIIILIACTCEFKKKTLTKKISKINPLSLCNTKLYNGNDFN